MLFIQLLYLDSVKCPAYTVLRERPAIQGWDFAKMKFRQELEMKEGGFGFGEMEPNFEEFMKDEDAAVDVSISSC